MAPTWTELTPEEQTKICSQIERNLKREGPRTQSSLAQRLALSHDITGRALADLLKGMMVSAQRTDSGVVLWRAA